jgi:hypothetical protein
MKRDKTKWDEFIQKIMQVGYLRRKGIMIAFLVFLALMIACIVGGVRLSMYLYRTTGTRYLSEQQLVTLSQEAFVADGSCKPRKIEVDMGMRDCAQRVGVISLGVVSVMILLIVMFVNASH